MNKSKYTYTMSDDDEGCPYRKFLIYVPKVKNNKVKVFHDNRFIGLATATQVKMIINELLLNNRKELSNLKFIGHRDGDKIGEEIEITVDNLGNLSEYPYEFNHMRRLNLEYINITKNLKK